MPLLLAPIGPTLPAASSSGYSLYPICLRSSLRDWIVWTPEGVEYLQADEKFRMTWEPAHDRARAMGGQRVPRPQSMRDSSARAGGVRQPLLL